MKGFSLIELLVVITIVAVLAAMAVPAYNSYGIKAKVAAVTPTLDGLLLQMKKFYEINGFMPTPQQLGYTGVDGFGGLAQSITTKISPYLVTYTGQVSGVWMRTNSSTFSNCAPLSVGFVGAIFDGSKMSSTQIFNQQYYTNNGDRNILIYEMWLYPTNGGKTWSIACGASGAQMGEYQYLPPKCQQVISSITCS